MTDTYSGLSGFARDVLTVVYRTENPLEASTIRRAVAALRDEPERDHTYAVLNELADADLVSQTADDEDGRVTRYHCTDNGRNAIEARFELVADVVCEHVDRSGRPTGDRLPDGGHPTKAQLAVLIDTGDVEASIEGSAAISVRSAHGDIRLEAATDGERTVEAVLAGEPKSLQAIAADIQAVATTIEGDDCQSSSYGHPGGRQ